MGDFPKKGNEEMDGEIFGASSPFFRTSYWFISTSGSALVQINVKILDHTGALLFV